MVIPLIPVQERERVLVLYTVARSRDSRALVPPRELRSAHSPVKARRGRRCFVASGPRAGRYKAPHPEEFAPHAVAVAWKHKLLWRRVMTAPKSSPVMTRLPPDSESFSQLLAPGTGLSAQHRPCLCLLASAGEHAMHPSCRADLGSGCHWHRGRMTHGRRLNVTTTPPLPESARPGVPLVDGTPALVLCTAAPWWHPGGAEAAARAHQDLSSTSTSSSPSSSRAAK